MSAEDIRAELRVAMADLDDLRRQMDEAAEAHNGSIPHDQAVAFGEKFEATHSRVWTLRARLRTPF